MSVSTPSWGADLLDRTVVALVGSGGVGKTTTSAAIGLHAARAGRRVLVLTIDPARRLADALGLEAIGNAETPVELTHEGLPTPRPGGSLHAMMLDTEGAFDELVSRLASDPERARAVQENRIYRHIIDSLAGAQEYLAGEKIYDDRVYRWLLPTAGGGPGRLVDKLLRAPSNVAKALLARVFGERFVGDLEEFFLVMQGIHAEVRQRSENVQRLLRDPRKTAFILVTAPIPSVANNAVFFHEQIRKRGFPFAGFIVNRVHPTPSSDALAMSGEDIQSALEALDAPAPSAGLGEALGENAARMSKLAARDRQTISALRTRMLATAPMTRVPRLGGAIHDVRGLALIAEHIFTADQGSEAKTS